MTDLHAQRKLLADPELLELLHRELEGELNPGEQLRLAQQNDNPDVQAARIALRRAVMFLSGPNPPALPRSIAATTAAEISLSQQLSVSAPPLPRSVARQVASEVALAQQLQQTTPALPSSVAAVVASDIATASRLAQPPLPPRSVASLLSARIAQEKAAETDSQSHTQQPAAVAPVLPPATTVNPPAPTPFRHSAPLLVGALLVGVTLLSLTTAWPNLSAGAVVLHTLLAQVSPLAGLGLALLLLTSVVVSWKPTLPVRRVGAGAFALAAALTIPALYQVAGGAGGLNIGQNVTVSGPVNGNVIAIGGNVNLKPGAQVSGEVVTLLGDVHRAPGSQVQGHIHALLGRVPGDRKAVQTRPVTNLNLATAAAFRPVLGWLGAAAWPQIFVALTGSLLLLLYMSGIAPRLARRQRHAPLQTLALGILILSLVSLPALGLALSGFLGLALIVSALSALLIAIGISVSLYDLGRAVAYRLRLPAPDVVGAVLGLTAFAASQSIGLLAFTLALVGGAWGAGTLFLSQRKQQPLA